MPAQPTYPGVYVREAPSQVRTIVGVSTSIGLFIGRTGKGRLNKPIRCLNYTDFAREFSEDTSVGDMAHYVRLFFLNGGTDCYVLRIAKNATAAEVTLNSETGQPALKLTAKQFGSVGETIRAAVTYAGAQAEATFNLEIFRWETNPIGDQVRVDVEEWNNLSMDPNSSRYAVDFLTQESTLVRAEEPGGIPAPVNGYSQSGRPVPFQGATPTTLRTAWESLIGDGVTTNKFEISADGHGFVPVDLSGIDVGSIPATSAANFASDLAGEIKDQIEDALLAAGLPGVTVSVTIDLGGPTPPAPDDDTALLRISSDNQGDVFIRPAASEDTAVPLMLGTEQGGLEVGAHAARRPAPTGITLRLAEDSIWAGLADRRQDSITAVVLDRQQPDGSFAPHPIPVDLVTTGGGSDPFYRDDFPASPNDNNDGVREKLALIRDAINDFRAGNSTTFFWRAELWGSRLAVLHTSGEDNRIGSFATEPNAADLPTAIPNSVTRNVRYYSVGIGGTAGLQVPAPSVARDGDPPEQAEYEAAFETVDGDMDLFNLMVLPPDRQPAVQMNILWGLASVFCRERRAFLLMDAPADWQDAQTASTGVIPLRMGLAKDHSAIFFPRLVINDRGLEKKVGPTGAIAGLMARIDSSRGVWKAPAGTEANLRGVVGLERNFSDPENGILNPRAINTIRVFPTGIVNWGARTMDGDDDFASEWKYVPVRRVALFIEESLYRGLKWAVFEPNDEPLWSQIRLNVGAFMNNLFRQGAFQGQKSSDAYFVKCDSETTTQNDINLGIVNVVVGFAPLKPAEFVILTIQQMAGQIQT